MFRGQRLVPLQVQAEWLTYQQIFDDVLTRLGAQLARQQKFRNEELKKLLVEHPSDVQPSSPHLNGSDLQERKSALRQRFAQARAPLIARSQPSAQLQPVPPEESQ